MFAVHPTCTGSMALSIALRFGNNEARCEGFEREITVTCNPSSIVTSSFPVTSALDSAIWLHLSQRKLHLRR
ncbi:unnamed protein product [Acanthocheilonema viteae]|uniref:Uncharacterized protein n=1 Tax=Acanthocheilonema viteae TaxID=6277 RepID=A0A498SKF5_ACAVI|nr:unnamed protein product [Acanthocheilonema viteae]